MPKIHANGVELYYEDAGPAGAPVILLIMGLGTQMIAWPEALIAQLTGAGYRVISYDNRDVGLSTHLHGAPAIHPLLAIVAKRFGLPAPLAYGLTDMAADAVALLDALDIPAAHVVGASMGGMIAQIVAATHPARVRSLTSIMSTSGAPGLPGPGPDVRKRLMARRPSNATRAQAVAAGEDTLRLIAYPDPSRAPDAFAEMAGRAYDRGYNPVGVRRQLLAIIADGSRAERLARITAPTLLVHGAADPLVPLACSEDIARRVPGARLEVIDEMAHDLPPSKVPQMAALIVAHAAATDARREAA